MEVLLDVHDLRRIVRRLEGLRQRMCDRIERRFVHGALQAVHARRVQQRRCWREDRELHVRRDRAHDLCGTAEPSA